MLNVFVENKFSFRIPTFLSIIEKIKRSPIDTYVLQYSGQFLYKSSPPKNGVNVITYRTFLELLGSSSGMHFHIAIPSNCDVLDFLSNLRENTTKNSTKRIYPLIVTFF